MNGRLLKFKLDTIPIDGNMDNFLNNIVMNRERHQSVVYVNVVGRSNDLSGVVAYNTMYPVIVCLPF